MTLAVSPICGGCEDDNPSCPANTPFAMYVKLIPDT